MKIYFAGPLFSEAERAFISATRDRLVELSRELGVEAQIIWPYELITQEEIDRLGSLARVEIFKRCRSHLDDTDVLIALLDGSQVDDGTAWEMGYFYGKGAAERPIVGIRTDFRRAGESEGSVVNAMLECTCGWIVRSSEELLHVMRVVMKG